MVMWNLDSLYKKEEVQIKKDQLKKAVDSFVAKKDQLTQDISPKRFISLLEEYENISMLSSVLSARVGLFAVENIVDPQRKKEEQDIDSFLTDMGNKLIYFMLFFKHLPQEKAEEIISQSGRFTYFLTRSREAIKHTRSEEEEKIINIKDLSGVSALDTIRDLIVGKFSFSFQGEKLVEPQMRAKYSSANASERELAYKTVLAEYEKNQDVLGEVYKNIALDWYNEAKEIRHHTASISARNFSNAVSDDVIKLVLDVIQENVSLFHEYFKLKNKTLNTPFSRYHVYAPYNLKEEKKYSFEESKQITLSVFEKFSPQAKILAQQIFDSNHIHSEVQPNKRGGAFCYSVLKDSVPFVMLNHMDRLDDLSTMCHELGHGIHGQLAKDKTQFTFHSSISLAEVASVFAELLLKEELLQQASCEEKKYLLFKELDSYFATILRQAYFALFELSAHEKIKQGTTVSELNNIYFELLQEEFGDMHVPQEFKFEWLSIPHIYNSPFYVYSYAFANLIVLALYAKYKEDKESFLPKYFSILSAGGDADVADIMKEAGFDITSKKFWQGGMDTIEETLINLKKLLSE